MTKRNLKLAACLYLVKSVLIGIYLINGLFILTPKLVRNETVYLGGV